MNSSFKKTLFAIIPIAIGIGVIWYFLAQLSPQDKKDIINSFKSANYWWVGLSLFFGMLSHFSRAYRWQFLFEPLGYKPRFVNSFMTVLMAYLVNLAMPRAGDVARGTAISRYEKIPFEKAIGTIVAERIADVILLLFIIGIAFISQAELIKGYLFKNGTSSTVIGILILLLLGGFAIIGFQLIQRAKSGFLLRVKKFVNGLFEGAISIFRMKKKWPFILHTFFIWVMYVLMFYVVTFALPETTHLPFEAIIVGFVVGGLSMALTNGGLGTYPVFVAGALALYGVAGNPANAFGWIMWTAQTLMIIVFGGFSFLLLPIYNRNRG
ncbi:MAG: lysylphosphatidylglycerol synthase transmembrane domain-containing protein [Flavobacteriaceae bacterium]|nr:lysylphosphatidylglycerol synthase transmembrane domain-containing protein [Flavobacteriaceae bacterium]